MKKKNCVCFLSQGYLQPISFPSLQSIWIHRCCNLKSLFPISVTRSLSNLISIEIQGASKLKQVFGYEGELNVEDEEKGIVFPKFEDLELLELPSLTSFAPMGYNFQFPSLVNLEVRRCPYRITRFSEDSRGIVHAITEVTNKLFLCLWMTEISHMYCFFTHLYIKCLVNHWIN